MVKVPLESRELIRQPRARTSYFMSTFWLRMYR
jgi:hypothetical protein